MECKATRYEVEEGVAVISLNRPHRLNAWTGRMHSEYLHHLCTADEDAKVRAIIVTGVGKAFCAGGDAAALQGHVERGSYDAGTGERLREPRGQADARFSEGFACHWNLTKPVIAVINGAAAGIGLALACYADLRFAATGAKLTAAHGKLNLPAEFGLSWLLPRMMGTTHAMELLLSSRIVLAEEAFSMGLVNQVFPAQRLMEESLKYARRLIRQVSPNSLKVTRWQLYRDLHRDISEANQDADRLLRQMVTEPNFKEGVQAFVDKRTPKFVA